MADRLELACLRITTSGYFQPAPMHKLTLDKQGESCWIETQNNSAENVSAAVPAFPLRPLVCDGEFSNLRLGWWALPPFGADALADFAGWLRGLGLPDEEEQDDD